MSDINLPSLIVHGEADPLNRADGARALFAAISHPDKSLRIYPGVLHEPHNDVQHEQVAADIKDWLARVIT